MKTVCLLLVAISWAALMYGQRTENGDRRGDAQVTRPEPNRRPMVNRPPQVPGHQTGSSARRATHKPPATLGGNRKDIHQTGARQSPGIPGSVTNNRRSPARPPDVAGLNGQQFKQGWTRRSSPAILRGSVNATKNTAAINGTAMKHRP